MASKIVDGRKVLVGSKADPSSDRYDPKKTGTIKLSQLNQAQPPAQLPPPQPTAQTSPLDASLAAVAKTLPEQAKLKREASQANEEDSFAQFMDAQLNAPTETQARVKAEKDANLQELEANATQLSNDLLAEQERLRKEVERIETAPGTATAAERNLQIAEATRVSRRQQADIAITQLAAQGQFDIAQKYVDRAVQAEMEAVTRKLDVYKQIYDRAQTLFTRDEQREFEIALADREREEELKVFEYKANLEQKIKQSDPLYRLELQLKQNEVNKLNSTGTTASIKSADGKLDPTGYFTSVIKNTGAKDNANLQAVGGVLAAIQGFAEANPDGTFPGLGPVARFNPVTDQAATSNRGAIKAINLKVQQWASGASLTKQQTDYVNSITPTDGDWGPQLKQKTNALTNFMLSQAKGTLSSQGIQFDAPTVDFFNKEAETADFLDTVDATLSQPATIYTQSGYSL